MPARPPVGTALLGWGRVPPTPADPCPEVFIGGSRLVPRNSKGEPRSEGTEHTPLKLTAGTERAQLSSTCIRGGAEGGDKSGGAGKTQRPGLLGCPPAPSSPTYGK